VSRLSSRPVALAVRYAAVPVCLLLLGLLSASNPYWIHLVTAAAIAYMLTAAFNLVYGYAGTFNLAIVATYGLGAFVSVYAENHLGWNFWLTIPLAVGVCTLLSVLLALPSRRLNELFLAIETLAFALAMIELLKNWKDFSGGTTGIYDVGVPSLFGTDLVGGKLPFYWLAAIGAALTFELVRRIHGSGMGRQFVALREGPRVLAAVGASPGSVSLIAFALSGAIAGLAGVIYGRFQLYIALDAFGFHRLIELLLATTLGGAGFLWGPVFGVVALVVMDELSIATSQSYELIFGIAILLLVSMGQGGIAGALARQTRRWVRQLGQAAVATGPELRLRIEPGHRNPTAQLAVRDVTVQFGGTQAVVGASLQVDAGDIVGLIGPNGAGKTSLFNAITGDVRTRTGSITIGGVELIGRHQEEIVRLGIGRTFQSPQVVPDLSLLENLMLAGDGLGNVGWVGHSLHTSGAQAQDGVARLQAMHLLKDFGLEHRAHQPAREQTYGVLRIVEVARNLMLSPQFLLLDEPGAGLTEAEREELAEHILAVRNRGIGVLLVDHNLPLMRSTCSRLYVLSNGRVIAQGAPDEVFAHADVVSAYLGVVA
jgi:branched-chain amino acid transport system permease protein